MGTRADFYVGAGATAEWIGSVAWDGYEWGERIERGDPDAITESKYEQEFRNAVAEMLRNRRSGDGTTPDMGWPWPWNDSRTTDCAYCFVDGGVRAFSFGEPWGEGETEHFEWPDMADRKNVTMGSRSGLIVISG